MEFTSFMSASTAFLTLIGVATFFLIASAIITDGAGLDDVGYGSFITALIIVWVAFNINPIEITWATTANIIIGAAAYLITGIIWSIFRFNRWVSAKYKNYGGSVITLMASKNKARIAYYVYAMPLSIVSYICSHFLSDLTNVIVGKLARFYDSTLNAKIEELKQQPQPKEKNFL